MKTYMIAHNNLIRINQKTPTTMQFSKKLFLKNKNPSVQRMERFVLLMANTHFVSLSIATASINCNEFESDVFASTFITKQF